MRKMTVSVVLKPEQYAALRLTKGVVPEGVVPVMRIGPDGKMHATFHWAIGMASATLTVRFNWPQAGQVLTKGKDDNGGA